MTDHSRFPFEDPKVLHERMIQRKQRFRPYLEAPLLKIGQLFTGEERVNCREKPKEKLKRFQLYESDSSFGVFLWSGTSLYIECDETDSPDVDDFWRIERDSGDKLTRIHLYISSKPNFSVNVFIRDELKVFPSEYRSYNRDGSSLDELNEELNDLITHLAGK
jgi:hypothetical protein